MQQPNVGLGFSNGAQYLNPRKIKTKVENGFSIIIKETGLSPKVLELMEIFLMISGLFENTRSPNLNIEKPEQVSL